MSSNKDLEEKLEKDSLSIKEQILNLQNEIKKFKSDMCVNSTESKLETPSNIINNNVDNFNAFNIQQNTKFKKTYQEDENDNMEQEYFPNKNKLSNKENQVGYFEMEKNNFKFSFNQKQPEVENNNNDLRNSDENYNCYRNSNTTFKASLCNNNENIINNNQLNNNNLNNNNINLSNKKSIPKIPSNNNLKPNSPFQNVLNNVKDDNEEENFQPFPENLMNNNSNNTTKIVRANMQKFFDEEDSDDYNSHKNYANTKSSFNINNPSFQSENINDISNNSLKQKLNSFVNNYSNIKEDSFKEEFPDKLSKKNFYQTNVEKLRKEKQLFSQISKNRTSSQKQIPFNNNKEDEKDDGEYGNDNIMNIDELDKDTSNKYKDYNYNYPKRNQYCETNEDENSLDEKIKKLQRKKLILESKKPIKKAGTNRYDNINNQSNTSIKNKTNNFSSLSRTKSSGKIRSAKTLNKPLIGNKASKSKNKIMNNNNNHTNNFNTINNVNSNNKSKDAEIKSYQNEIANLKLIISQLKNENEKLKNSLQKERSQNEKFRKLTEEIIKHYEQTKKI